MTPGYNNFYAFCAKCEINPIEEDTDPILAEEAGYVTDDDDPHDTENEKAAPTSLAPQREQVQQEWQEIKTPNPTSFDLNSENTINIVENEEDLIKDNATAMLLQYHQKWRKQE